MGTRNTKSAKSGGRVSRGPRRCRNHRQAVYFTQAQPSPKPAKTVLAAQPEPPAPVAQPHSDTIVDTAFTIESGKWTAYKFEVPPNAKNVKVNGHFAASGGARNSIQVFLTDEDGIASEEPQFLQEVLYQRKGDAGFSERVLAAFAGHVLLGLRQSICAVDLAGCEGRCDG